MTDSIEFSEISVLIPGHSIEDLPTELDESPASSLLNALACAWHPALLARTSGVPILRNAESMTGYPGRRVILVPQPAESWMPHEWRTTLRSQNHVILDGCTERAEWLAAIHTAVDAPDDAARCPLIPDFLALGTLTVQVSLLSRRRHHFVDADNMLLGREAKLAALAALQDDHSTAQVHLGRCFEHLRDTREKFFPMNCYLLDICIPPEHATAHDISLVCGSPHPLSLFTSGTELRAWQQADHQHFETLRSSIEQNRVCLLSGNETETRLSLGTMAFGLLDLRRGRATARELTGAATLHHLRRRFGLTASLPSLLRHVGFDSTLHVALDDGLYPDREHSAFDWQAPDGSVIAASSRIPLAIDSASGFLRLVDRLNEALSDSTCAALPLARLPQLKSPWLTDLHHAARYAPVLGEFVTPATLVTATEGTRQPQRHGHQEYLSPFLIQSAVLASEPPVTGPAAVCKLQQRWLSIRRLLAIAVIMRADVRQAVASCHDPGGPPTADRHAHIQTTEPLITHAADMSKATSSAPRVNPASESPQVHAADQLIQNVEGIGAAIAELESRLADVSQTWTAKSATCEAEFARIRESLKRVEDVLLASIEHRLPHRSATSNGLLLLNTLPFSRTVPIDWPGKFNGPARSDHIAALQHRDNKCRMLVDLPPGGFAWLLDSTDSSDPARPTLHPVTTPDRREPPLAEPLLLRNRHFEVTLSERTGGIESVRMHGRRGNRLSQQTCFRFEREQIIPPADEDSVTMKTSYAECVLRSQSLVESGPVFASVSTTCELRSPVDGAILAVVTQLTALNRLQPRIQITLTFDEIATRPKGNPWLCYFGCRFAWENELAAVTRSVLGHAAGFRAERFESPDYIEVADDDQRLCIIPHGRPYHRRSGPRMLDSLLIVEGESGQSFTFTIELDHPFPLRAAAEAMTPVCQRLTSGISPTKLDSSWIIGLSARNVNLVDIEVVTPAGLPEPQRVRVWISETEGTSADCHIRLARRPVRAVMTSPDNSSPRELSISDSGIRIPIGPFQLREILVEFAPSAQPG